MTSELRDAYIRKYLAKVDLRAEVCLTPLAEIRRPLINEVYDRLRASLASKQESDP